MFPNTFTIPGDVKAADLTDAQKAMILYNQFALIVDSARGEATSATAEWSGANTSNQAAREAWDKDVDNIGFGMLRLPYTETQLEYLSKKMNERNRNFLIFKKVLDFVIVKFLSEIKQ